MEAEVEWKSYNCYVLYINETSQIYQNGLLNQYNNHSTQMENKFENVDFNLTSGVFKTGDTACSLESSQGATVGSRDPYGISVYSDNGDYDYTEYIYATDYDRNRTTGPKNFSSLEEFLGDECNSFGWCQGWTWIDSYYDGETNQTIDQSFYLLSSIADPINSNKSGICYEYIDYSDANTFSFSSINAIANYTNYLENLYLSNYQSDVDSLYDTLSNMWDSIKEIYTENPNHNFTVFIDTDADEFDVSFDITDLDVDINITRGTVDVFTHWEVIISCPGCPESNFSEPYLQQVADYSISYDASNISQLFSYNDINFSDVVAVNQQLLDFPPTSKDTLPIDFESANFEFLSLIAGIAISLDIILFIYRWNRTAQIVARIIRGKNVRISIKHLGTTLHPQEDMRIGDPRCCQGETCLDKILSKYQISSMY